MRLFDRLKRRGRRQTEPKRPHEQILTGDYGVFQRWIESTIGGPFVWRVRPRDNADNRLAVADAILASMRSAGGRFPDRNAFIERARLVDSGATETSVRAN